MITYRVMDPSEIERIGEVDRSERVTAAYVVEDGSLRETSVDWKVPEWSQEGVRSRIDAWRPFVEGSGTMIGAFDGQALVGFVIHRQKLEPDMGQLVALFVTCDHRGRGVGGELADRCVELAERAGATRLYVSSVPTKGTVDFYRGLGFELTHTPHPELFALEPEDVHMVMAL